MAARAARAREERIEGIAQRAVRRVMHSGLLRGWTSWFDAWGEKARTRPAPRTLTPHTLRPCPPHRTPTPSPWLVTPLPLTTLPPTPHPNPSQ